MRVPTAVLALALAVAGMHGARAAGCGPVAAAYRATLAQGRLPPDVGSPEWCARARGLLPALEAFLAAAARSPRCEDALMAPLQSGQAAHLREGLASCPP